MLCGICGEPGANQSAKLGGEPVKAHSECVAYQAAMWGKFPDLVMKVEGRYACIHTK